MKRFGSPTLSIPMLLLAACTSGQTLARDPGKFVLPPKHVSVLGRVFATKHRTLYRFSGTRLTALFSGTQIKDPAVTTDGTQLAFAQLDNQSSTIVVTDASGQNQQAITSASAPEGALWAFAPTFSADGRHIAYLTDRGKQPSNPENLRPNDLAIWVYDATSGQSRRLVAPVPLHRWRQ